MCLNRLTQRSNIKFQQNIKQILYKQNLKSSPDKNCAQMMFNEYMDHANQCAGYYSVTRKEEISLQQSETNRFKQKWLESSGGGYSAPQQNPTPPPGQQFNNKNMPQHIKQEHQGYPMSQGQFMNNQYKQPSVTPMQLKQMNQPNNLEANQQHMMMKQQQHMKASHAQKMQQSQAQMQYQQQQQQQQQQQGNKYYEVI